LGEPRFPHIPFLYLHNFNIYIYFDMANLGSPNIGRGYGEHEFPQYRKGVWGNPGSPTSPSYIYITSTYIYFDMANLGSPNIGRGYGGTWVPPM
jgi:hypothetical protein